MIVRLDIDAPRKPMALARLCWLLRRAGYRPRWLMQTHSPGGKGWHVELALIPEPRSALEVVALQAVLGSDASREACNINRARMVETGRVSPWWRARWNVLYGGRHG